MDATQAPLDPEVAEAAPVPDRPLRDLIADELLTHIKRASSAGPGALAASQADAVMALLNECGHYLPGAPPAAQILKDAQEFASKLILSNLALRILNMLAFSKVQTPETAGVRRWLDDYLEGRNHGPVGAPMLWPGRMPGICHLLKEWGFEPTKTMPPFVARSLPHPLMQ